MNHSQKIVNLLTAIALAGSPLLAAQSTASSSTAAADPAGAESSPAPSYDSHIPEPTYVPALDGTGLIALDHTLHTRYLYGAKYSGGYDTNPNDVATAPSAGAFLFSPFAGIEADLGNVQYVFQYQPTLRRYTGNAYQSGSLHTASGRVGGSLSERWTWDVHALGSHGLDSIRLLSPQQNIAIGDVPGTGPASAAYRPDAGTITYVEGGAGLTYKATERDSIQGSLGNSFSSYSGLHGDSNIAQATVSYAHSVTPKFQWIDYGQGARYYGVIHCFTYGGGVGLEWKPEEHGYLHLSGGPQLNSAGCGKQQGFAYGVDYSERLTQKSQVYLTSARQTASTYLGPGLWQQTVSIGMQHDFDHSQSVGVDFGYVGTTTLEGVKGYSGTYVDAGYSYRFLHSLIASLTYRRYAGDYSDSSFIRNTVLASISWAPRAGHIFQ